MSILQAAGPIAPAAAQPAAANQPVSKYTFSSNRVRLFNEDPFGSLGFGAIDAGPYGYFSQNEALRQLADEIGLIQFLVTTDAAARGWEPPNAFLAARAAQAFNRAKTLLNAQTIVEGDRQQQQGMDSKSDQSAEPFKIHPVPFFRGPMMMNQWIDSWNRITMRLQINLMLDPSNRFGFGITQYCYNSLMPFLNQLAVKIGVELCNLPAATVLDPKFLFDLGPTGQFTPLAYQPSQLVINQSALWTQGPTMYIPTISDMQPFLEGIDAHVCALLLAQFPKGPIPGASGIQGMPNLTRDAVLAYWAAQPDQPATAQSALVDAINAAATQTTVPGATTAAAGAAPSPAATGAPAASPLKTIPG
jgi:hypothetical protein